MHQIGVFQAISVKVTKATSIQSREHDRPVIMYTMEVDNKESQTSWSTTRSDSDFKSLHAAVCNALDHGHTCDALCPWFYVDFQQKLPKKSLFRSRTHKRSIQANLDTYHDLLSMLMAFIIASKNHSCYRANDRVSNVLFDFLFRDCSVVDAAVYTSAKQRSSTSSIRSSQSDDCECSLCNQGSNTCSSWTRLPCGHVFHDDCILEALNKSVACPECHGAML